MGIVDRIKCNPIINVLRTEWEFLGKRRLLFVFYMTLFFIAGIIGLMTTLVIGWLFNSIQQTISGDINMNEILLKIGLLLGISIFFWMVHGPARIIESLTGFHVHKNYTNNKIFKILELPVKWHKDHHSGDTIDKINRGRDSIESFSMYFTFELMGIIMHIFGSLLILFLVDVKIGIFALLFSIFILAGVMIVDRKLRQYYLELNKYSNKLSSAIFDYLSNIITVITLRLKKTVSKEINYRLDASYSTFKKEVIINEIKWAFGSISIAIMTVAALVYKAYFEYMVSGIILIGTLYILYEYLKIVGDAFFDFGRFYGRLVKLNARIEGAYPIDCAFNNIKEKVDKKIHSSWKEIRIDGLEFTYNDEGKKKHLENVNIKFKRGEKIALVGESGSGKSTLLAILRGLYLPQKGKVYCDGEEIENGFETLKQHITLIPQDPEIFNNTIEYNITMDLPASKENVEKVVKMAQFKNVVERLENGLQTNVLEKGVSLSGGEKQRLALARGLLAARKSDIVLLDEPTSSVDTVNEMRIYEHILRAFRKKTIISSIHKLYLLYKFDYIYLFDNGKLITEGTIEEIKKNRKFKNMLIKYGLKKEVK